MEGGQAAAGRETKESNDGDGAEGWKSLLKPFCQHVGGCQKKSHSEDIFSVNLQLDFTSFSLLSDEVKPPILKLHSVQLRHPWQI